MSAKASWSVFLLALALRLAVFAELQDEPLFRTPQLDALEYMEWGARLGRGDFSWPVAPIHGPGYPLFIGTILGATKSVVALRIAQAILGGIAAFLVMAMAGRLYGPVAGFAAGVLHATYGPLIFVDVSILAEGLFVFLLTLTLWLLTQRKGAPGAGLALGASIIVRPTSLALVPLFACFASPMLAFLAATAGPVIPVLILNRMHTPDVIAVQTSGAMNFYIGNSPLHDGTAWARPGGGWDSLRGAAGRAGARRAAEADRFYMRAAMKEIAGDPAAFTRLLGGKMLWLVQNEEVRDSHSFHFFAESSQLLRWLPGFGVVFALAVCGVVVARGRPRPHGWWLIAGYALVIGATVVGLVAGLRYRIPVMPALFIFAGAAISFAIAAVAQRQWKRVGALALIFTIATVVSHVRKHPESHDFSEEMTMTALALKNEGDLAAAVEAAQRATVINPARDAAWVALGDIEATRGRWREAERAWKKAIDADPNNARAWSHLGLARILRGEREQAEAAIRRALSIRYDEEAAHNLELLLRQ